MNNLLVLARDSEEGARRIWQEGKIVGVMMGLIKNREVDEKIALTAIRIIDELAKNRERVRFGKKNRERFSRLPKIFLPRSLMI